MESPFSATCRSPTCYSLPAAGRGARGQGANWCTFATWASRQAGATIRGEDTLDLPEARLGRRWVAAAPAPVPRALVAAARAAGRRIASGPVHGPAAHAVRRGRTGERRRRARQPQGFRGDRIRVFARWLAEEPGFIDSLRDGDPPDGERYCAPRSGATRDRPGRRNCCSPTSRSACTSRRACSRRSARRSTPRRSRPRSSAGASVHAAPAHPEGGGCARGARPGPAGIAFARGRSRTR